MGIILPFLYAKNIKNEKTLEKKPYILNNFCNNNISYYYDDNDFILNTEGVLIGFFVNDNEFKILSKWKESPQDWNPNN